MDRKLFTQLELLKSIDQLISLKPQIYLLSDEDLDEPEEGDASYIEGGLSQNLVEDIESRLTEKLNLTKDNLRFLTGESISVFLKECCFFSVYFKFKFG